MYLPKILIEQRKTKSSNPTPTNSVSPQKSINSPNKKRRKRHSIFQKLKIQGNFSRSGKTSFIKMQIYGKGNQTRSKSYSQEVKKEVTNKLMTCRKVLFYSKKTTNSRDILKTLKKKKSKTKNEFLGKKKNRKNRKNQRKNIIKFSYSNLLKNSMNVWNDPQEVNKRDEQRMKRKRREWRSKTIGSASISHYPSKKYHSQKNENFWNGENSEFGLISPEPKKTKNLMARSFFNTSKNSENGFFGISKTKVKRPQTSGFNKKKFKGANLGFDLKKNLNNFIGKNENFDDAEIFEESLVYNKSANYEEKEKKNLRKKTEGNFDLSGLFFKKRRKRKVKKFGKGISKRIVSKVKDELSRICQN